MSTYSAPIFRKINNARTVWGVVTADVSLHWLQNYLSSIKLYRSGYAFLISKKGTFATHPDKRLILHESIFSIAAAKKNKRLRRIGMLMVHGDTGFEPLTDFHTGKPSYIYYTPLYTSGWSIGIMVPEDELLADMDNLTERIIMIAAGGIIFMLIITIVIAKTMTRPLQSLATMTVEIARGNLDQDLPEIHSNDEIGKLTRSFGQMKTALKEYIANLERTTAAKERMESELMIARKIQMSFLPKRFPPFPDREEIDLYAAIEPAREVGGDLYDFFLLDDDRLFLLIGDVSDKGVPAALFMAVTRTLFKSIAKPGLPPSEILRMVNIELHRDNESMMFVTIFCAILNMKTGELNFSNAGHNPPLILRRNGIPRYLEIPEGIALGVYEPAVYTTGTVVLEPMDILLAYTDGVTEAENARGEMYSDELLLELSPAIPRDAADKAVMYVLEAIKEFSMGAPQHDDITIVSLLYRGKTAGKN